MVTPPESFPQPPDLSNGDLEMNRVKNPSLMELPSIWNTPTDSADSTKSHELPSAGHREVEIKAVWSDGA